MRLGICTGIGSLADAAEAGYEFAELTVVGNLKPDEDESVFRESRDAILASPIPVEAFMGFIPSHHKVVGPEVDLPRVATYMDTAMRRAAEVGASIIVFGSGRARSVPEGFDRNLAWKQLEEAARLAGETAARHGLTVVMEPLRKQSCNILNTVAEGIEFVDRVNHPNLKLLADNFHLEAEAESLENVARAGSRLAHVHLATPSIPETGEGVRCDFPGFFSALQAAGYSGRLSVEDNPGLFRAKEPPLTETYRAVRVYLEQYLRG